MHPPAAAHLLLAGELAYAIHMCRPTQMSSWPAGMQARITSHAFALHAHTCLLTVAWLLTGCLASTRTLHYIDCLPHSDATPYIVDCPHLTQARQQYGALFHANQARDQLHEHDPLAHINTCIVCPPSLHNHTCIVTRLFWVAVAQVKG
jgi:hypothetical protein